MTTVGDLIDNIVEKETKELKEIIADKDAEIADKDAEIARLNAIISSQK